MAPSLAHRLFKIVIFYSQESFVEHMYCEYFLLCVAHLFTFLVISFNIKTQFLNFSEVQL
jgi:hypothetical protein